MSTFVNPVTAAVVFRGGELWRLGSDLMLLDCLGRVTVVDFSSSGDENVVLVRFECITQIQSAIVICGWRVSNWKTLQRYHKDLRLRENVVRVH